MPTLMPAAQQPLLGRERQEQEEQREQFAANVKAHKEWMDSRILDWFGSRAIVEEAFNIIESHLSGKGEDAPSEFRASADFENLIVGPALKYAWRANYIVWGGFFILSMFAWHLVHVDENGIADPPSGLWLVQGVVIFVVSTLVCLYFEVLAAMYVLPCQAIAMGSKPGMCGLPFWLWLSLMAIISFALKADIYTTAIFIARVAKSTTANIHFLAHSKNFGEFVMHGAEQHSASWWLQETQNNSWAFVWAMHNPCNVVNYQWQQSVAAGALSSPWCGWFFTHNSFVEVTYYAGFLMFMQFINAFCFSWPVSPDLKAKVVTDAYPSTDMVDGKAEDRQIPARYNTLLKTGTGHGRALQALAESGRMNILNWQDDNYLEVAEQEWESSNVVQEMRRGNIRFLLFGLQSVCMPNLQLTYLGIQNHGAGDADWLTFCSSCLTVVCGLKYVLWELSTLKKHRKFAADALERDAAKAQDKADNALAWNTKVLARKVKVRLCANLAFCVFFIVMYLYLGLKAYMDMVGCKPGVWNFDHNVFWNHTAGCMRLNFNVSEFEVNGARCNRNDIHGADDRRHRRLEDAQLLFIEDDFEDWLLDGA